MQALQARFLYRFIHFMRDAGFGHTAYDDRK